MSSDRTDPAVFQPFEGQRIVVETAEDSMSGVVVDAWRWFTGSALGIRFDSPRADAFMVLPDDETWTVRHADEPAPAFKHVPPDADTASSASRQHYIETGHYLTHAEVAEYATCP